MNGAPDHARAWYEASIEAFLEASNDEVMGRLATNSQFPLVDTQRNAWLDQLAILRRGLIGLEGVVFLEFDIPRVGKRIDAVLIVGAVVFVIEFKVGGTAFDREAVEQVWDYALDLKNFHEASHAVAIVPILVATEASAVGDVHLSADADGVYRPVTISAMQIRTAIDSARAVVKGDLIDSRFWSRAPYRPTPTIIEAARALYAQHSVEEIARYDAGAQNLRVTSARVEALIDEARTHGRKVVCFVTGVPGAGKTLVGLNVATRRGDKDNPSHAVFLSGNGPLVAVLREALIRDELKRSKLLGESPRRGVIAASVKAFIQNVHNFRDEGLRSDYPPSEHVAIFDEAQRAWNLERTANFMRQRRLHAGFNMSEPEFLISCMDRRQDWAVIVCLVGGGQDINRGEAGIDPWLAAIASKFRHWHVYISGRLKDNEYAAGAALDLVKDHPNVHFDDDLHLAVSMRSFRAEHVSSFVKAMLDGEIASAQHALSALRGRYPVLITRDLYAAKRWVRDRARGSERYGLITSSKAQRLKPHAIDIRVSVDPVHWFLNGKDDTRSSYYLEDAATEFQVQGLEVDWACVAWDGDLRHDGSGWKYYDFVGNRWKNIWNEDNRRYLLNAYRVLLTRARQGMVIFVPHGEPEDPTRLPAFYDSTYRYLMQLGIPQLV